MGFLGFGKSGRNDQAERNGERAWEELQETTEEVQGVLQEELSHAKHVADHQAQKVKHQLGHARSRAGDAAERGRDQADEVSGRTSNAVGSLKRKAEDGAHAVAERARGAGNSVKEKAHNTKESAQEGLEEESHRAKGMWWEKKETADRAAQDAERKTRNNLRSAEQSGAERMEETKRAAAQKAEGAKENVQYGAQRAKDKVRETAETTKSKMGEVKDRVAGKGQQLKRGASEKVEQLEEDAERTKEAAQRKAEEARRTAVKPAWWLGRKADEGADKVAEGVGRVGGAVKGTAEEVRETAGRSGRWVGHKADQATDKAAEVAGYAAGYAEGTVEEVAHGGREAFRYVKDKAGDDLRVPVKTIETPFIKIRSRTLKEVLAGGAAGAIAQSFVAPLEVVRTKLLGGRSGENVKEVVRDLNRSKGKDWPLQQTSGSFGLNVLRVAIQKGVELATYEKVKSSLKKRGHRHDRQLPVLDKLPRRIPESTWAGAAAGVASTLATYPFETLKDRVLIMPEKYKGFGDALRQVVTREGGIPALYRGVLPAMLCIVPQATINYYTYDTLTTRYRKKHGRKHVPPLQTLLYGATAGALSQFAVYPLEVARKQVSMSVLPAVGTAKAGDMAYKNVFEAVRGVLREEGPVGLYKGIGAQLAQIVPVAGLSWVVFETAKRALQAEEEEENE